MHALQAIRQSQFIARCVLAWFALSMAVAVAAPIVNPQASALVCSASGAIKLVSSSDDSTAPVAAHTLDCVLCLALNTPPVAGIDLFAQPSPVGQHLPALAQAPVPFRSDSKLLARGPPALI